jgi:hypothetical protein
MKYLKTFESGELDRFIKSKYLSKEDSSKLEGFVRKYISNLDIFNKIKKLKLIDFEEYDFNFDAIYDKLINAIVDYNPNTFKKTDGNLYYHVDKFVLNNISNYNSLKIRNTLFIILDKIYTENVKNGIKTKLEDKLIKLFEKNPEKYRELSSYDIENLPLNVQTACEWILSIEKYNL